MSDCPVDHGEKSTEGCPIDSSVSAKTGLIGWLESYQAKSKSGQAAPKTSSSSSSFKQVKLTSKSGDDSSGYNDPANDEHFGQEETAWTDSAALAAEDFVRHSEREYTPAHQFEVKEKEDGSVKSSKWIYPSEQQYFNAMKRKGYNPRNKRSAQSSPYTMSSMSAAGRKSSSGRRFWVAWTPHWLDLSGSPKSYPLRPSS